MNLKVMAKQLEKGVNKNSPTILTVMGAIGVVTTAVLAAKATPKALAIIEENRYKYVEGAKPPHKLKPVDYVRLTWKEYLPAALMCSATISCIFGANSIHWQRTAAISSIYSITETAFKEYQAKVIQTLGEKKEEKIREEIAEDRLKANPASQAVIYSTGDGTWLCYDSLSGRYFRSDIEKLRKVENAFNKTLRSEMWLSLNELYSDMGLEPIDIGNEAGWDVDTMMEFVFMSKLSDKGEPVLVVAHQNLPQPYTGFA